MLSYLYIFEMKIHVFILTLCLCIASSDDNSLAGYKSILFVCFLFNKKYMAVVAKLPAKCFGIY